MMRPAPPWVRYAIAVAGVGLASLCIAAVRSVAHVANISLLYLLVVLWLAARYGRGPAILASALAFLAYDFFFIPPILTLTVNDPAEWLSLFALLATALVVGQATATVRERAQQAIASERLAVESQRAAEASQREALASQQRTATLYALAELIVRTPDQTQLLDALAARVVEVFASAGVRACALILPDERRQPTIAAVAPAGTPLACAFDLSDRTHAGWAAWILERGNAVGGRIGPRRNVQGSDAADASLAYYIPLRTSERRAVVGGLGITGTPEIRWLASLPPHASGESPRQVRADVAERQAQTELFGAFCTLLALALDRLALQREAIHVEALRESDQLKNALLGSVTHDLRTPLASIQAAVGSLLEPDIVWNDAERREFLDSIAVSADRLSRLVSNLLDLSRLEAGVAAPEKQWYPIGDVIAHVLDRLDLAGRTEGRRITVEVPDDLPLVPMDHAQIEQVLTNLIENALKYSPAESGIAIQARALSDPAALEVRVRDQGIGIPAHELGAIFDKFYRVQHIELPWAPRRPPIGTGLGLAICAAIVRAHGGRIWAESTPGVGSTFAFTLPMTEAAPQGQLPELATALDETTSDEPAPVGAADDLAHDTAHDTTPAAPTAKGASA
jgi:two-component system sensor histidine kinase KdpD